MRRAAPKLLTLGRGETVPTDKSLISVNGRENLRTDSVTAIIDGLFAQTPPSMCASSSLNWTGAK
jgi:hypothetical protein